MSYGFRSNADDAESFLKKYVAIVQRVAHKMASQEAHGIDVQDLIQAGMICLLDCRTSHDPKTGVPMEAFITQKVRWAITDEMRRHDWAPRTVRSSHIEIQKAIASLTRQGVNKPGEERIAEELGVSIDKYRKMLQDSLGVHIVHYDDIRTGMDADEEMSRSDFLDKIMSLNGANHDEKNPLDAIQTAQSAKILTQAIKDLPEREQLILSLYFEADLTFREIAETLDISVPRVHQLKTQAIARLRAAVL